jgi:hypothetical protein
MSENAFIVSGPDGPLAIPHALGHLCLIGRADSGKTRGFLHPWITNWLAAGGAVAAFSAAEEFHTLTLPVGPTAVVNLLHPEKSAACLVHNRAAVADLLELVDHDPVVRRLVRQPHAPETTPYELCQLRQPGEFLSVVVGTQSYSQRVVGFQRLLMREDCGGDVPLLFVFDDACHLNFTHFIPSVFFENAPRVAAVCAVRAPDVFPHGRIPRFFGAALALDMPGQLPCEPHTRLFHFSNARFHNVNEGQVSASLSAA